MFKRVPVKTSAPTTSRQQHFCLPQLTGKGKPVTCGENDLPSIAVMAMAWDLKDSSTSRLVDHLMNLGDNKLGMLQKSLKIRDGMV